MKKYAIYTFSVLVVLVALAMGVNAYIGDSAPKVVVEGDYIEAVGEQSLGAIAGPNHYGEFRVHGAFTYGQGVLEVATSTGTTVLTAAQLMGSSVLELTVNTGTTATFTLPATSTLSGLLDAGASREWYIHNATSSTMALTIGAGAGMDLIGVTTNDDIIDETEYAELKCFRQTDTDFTCIISELLHVD